MYRTHTCGELTAQNIDETATLSGWIKKIRSFGKLMFIDLRDRYGITQLVFDTQNEDLSKITELKKESVIKVTGTIAKRAEGQANKDIPTGEIEMTVQKLEILSSAQALPIDLDSIDTVSDENKLKYRYLDLRLPEKNSKLIFRSKVTQVIRNYLTQLNFIEIETPLLIKSTPEGARDFVVPSRTNNGKFYALPQSPQIYKQILMVSGMDKYFQLAKCMRDEDLREDRQPEFTQLDMEMSFAKQEDVFKVIEGLLEKLFKETLNETVQIPLVQMTYTKALELYGIDKPDMRFGMLLHNVTKIAKGSNFKVFNAAEIVKCIAVPKIFSRKEIDKLTDVVKTRKAKGLAYLKFQNGTFDGPIAKFLNEKALTAIKENLGDDLTDESTVFFIADKENVTNASLSTLRLHLGNVLKLRNPKDFKFLWVTDFPLFEYDEDIENYVAAHHMFTMPKEETIEYLETDKSKVYANCYDLVLNGVELASGSERIHDRELQKRVMTAMNISEEQANEKFGFLLEAFKYGVPPHAGIAPGLDRLVALMLGFNDIREVIAFPKNKNMECPMDASPSSINEIQLEELGLSINPKK